MSKHELTRRAFLAATTTVAISARAETKPNTAKVVPGKVSPNENLNIAAIGAGGKGRSDIWECHNLGHNVVALCDVDWDRCATTFDEFPNAEKYKDYRNMLEEMPEIDACTISTPDHTHAPAAHMAMKLGKHVYVQKPLTHTVAEARLLKNTAAETGVATQMGNQGHCGDGVRTLCEMIWNGAIGQVREAHIWTSRPVWSNQGNPNPLEPKVAPENIDWDRWIGTAPWRPYNPGYAPHDWRAWQDFGAGALGDMACHIMDPAYMSLKLVEAPEFSVEVVMERGSNSQTFPLTSTVKYSFPARGKMGPVDVYWYDGHFPCLRASDDNKYPGHWPEPELSDEKYNRPKRPEGVSEDEVLGDNSENGSFFVGDKGVLTAGEYGGNPRIITGDKMESYEYPEQTIERIPGESPYFDWIRGCKGEQKPCSNFNYAGPFTEMVQFGNLVVKSGKKLVWDNIKGEVKNAPKDIVTKEYRKGWELPC